MTTEDDFHKALDENINGHQTRLVFADWLQERDDPRAEGYRVLGAGRFHPSFGWWFGRNDLSMRTTAAAHGRHGRW